MHSFQNLYFNFYSTRKGVEMPAVSKWLKINEFALSFPEFIFSEKILDCFCSHAIFDDKKSSELKNSENK